MEDIKYIVWKEGGYFISRCLNLEVASYGETVDEAIDNLKEAVKLYFEDEFLVLDSKFNHIFLN